MDLLLNVMKFTHIRQWAIFNDNTIISHSLLLVSFANACASSHVV